MARVEDKLEDLAILLGSISETLSSRNGGEDALVSVSESLLSMARDFNPNIEVKVPPQPAPVVRVDIPPIKVDSPQVNMAAPEVLPPDVVVNVPPRDCKPVSYKVRITERGARGINELEITPIK
jgi:hypothetical protein